MAEWKKVGMGITWNGNDSDGNFKLKKGDALEGIYLGKQENVGPNKSTMYEFRTTDRGVVSVWGSMVLDVRFKNLSAGQEVKVVYLGEAESQKRKGQFYHNYEVYHKEPEIPTVQDDEIPVIEENNGEVDPKDIPF